MADNRTRWAKAHDFTPTRDAESASHAATFAALNLLVRHATGPEAIDAPLPDRWSPPEA